MFGVVVFFGSSSILLFYFQRKISVHILSSAGDRIHFAHLDWLPPLWSTPPPTGMLFSAINLAQAAVLVKPTTSTFSCHFDAFLSASVRHLEKTILPTTKDFPPIASVFLALGGSFSQFCQPSMSAVSPVLEVPQWTYQGPGTGFIPATMMAGPLADLLGRRRALLVAGFLSSCAVLSGVCVRHVCHACGCGLVRAELKEVLGKWLKRMKDDI